MAKNCDYRPAGFEFDDYSDDEIYFTGGQDSDAGGTVSFDTRNTYDDFYNSETLDSNVRWAKDEIRANPVLQQLGKPLSLIILDDFRRAAIRNDVKVLDSFLQNGVDVECRLNSGWTVLMHAAYAASRDAVCFLLQHGADPNVEKDETTALMAACGAISSRHDEVLSCCNQLLDKGARVNTYDRNHKSPLMLAALSGHVAVVQRLIELHVEVDEQDNSGYTALMLAAKKGHALVVQTLLDAKADISKRTSDGASAADLALMAKHKQLQQLLDNWSAIQEGGVVNSDEMELVNGSETGQGDYTSWTNAPETPSHTFSNLDLFLSSLELNELIPVFQEKNISFAKFLQFTDHDLVQVGIHQLGTRKRILVALKETHKKNWETSSLIPLDFNKRITCLDSVGLVANVHLHAIYIASTISYMSDHISADNSIVLNTSEKEVEDLCVNLEETIVNARHVYKELHTLKTRLGKICRYHDFSSPDLIKPIRSNWKLMKQSTFFTVTVISCVLTAAWLNRVMVVSVLQKFFPNKI